VEVTLALLVVAIGLTATFALFPVGLQATHSAVSDTEISLFAEYVFTTLDLTAIMKGGETWSVDDCKHFKSLALDGGKNDPRFKIVETSGNQWAVFQWVPRHFGLAGSVYTDADFTKTWTSAFTYQLSLYDWTDGSTYARLVVCPGEYVAGIQPPNNEKRIFTRAIQAIRGEEL